MWRSSVMVFNRSNANCQEVGRCSTRSGSQRMYITSAYTMQRRQNPLWLWNPEETSPEIQNRGVSGSKIGHVNVSAENTAKQNKTKN